MHDLPDMYDFVCRLADEIEDELEMEITCPFRSWTNKERLSPLALAAAMGKVEIFQHILAQNAIQAWKYGPITCTMVPLRGLEQPDRLNGPEGYQNMEATTALDCICAGGHQLLTRCLKPDTFKLFSQV